MRSSRLSIRKRPSRLHLEELESRLVLTGAQPVEQLMLEQLNDIRADPAAYGVSIGVDLSNVAPAPALTFDPTLVAVAEAHAQDMNAQGYLGQVTPQGVDPGQRLSAAGFDWASWGESNLGGATYVDTASALKALIIDAGDATLATRNQLLGIGAQYQSQEQVGIGVVQNASGPQQNYYTIDTAVGSTVVGGFLTGTVFADFNGDDRYDAGEGLANVIISVSGAASTATATTTSGGYSLALPIGNYTVSASGGALAAPITQAITMGLTNTRLNFAVPNTNLPAGANAWVMMLYQDVLGRTPSPDEMAGWVKPLTQGASRLTVADAFLYSQEYTEDLVSGWFQEYLGRAPDPSGLGYFSNALMQGVSEDNVQLGIMESQEFFARSGGTDSGFVTTLYQDILGRTPNTTEALGWIAQAAADPGSVAAAFLESSEFKSVEVGQLYSSILRRSVDAGGLATFVNELASGQDERSVLATLLTSNEYYNNAPTILWIRSLYRDVLNESATNADVTSWLAQVNGGVSLSQVASAFLASDQWDQSVITEAYQALLGRAPDPSGLATYANLLQNTGTIASVVASIAESPEFVQDNGATDTSYIDALYQDLLGRAPLAPEVSYWLGVIQANALTLPEVGAEFVNSPEYYQSDISTMYSLYLHRSPVTSELTNYSLAIQAGQSDVALIVRILDSTEYVELAST